MIYNYYRTLPLEVQVVDLLVNNLTALDILALSVKNHYSHV